MDSLYTIKKKVRKACEKNLLELTKEYKFAADNEIEKKILSMSEYKNANIIFCYISTENEVNTIGIIENALSTGKCVGVPRCISKGIMMVYSIKNLGQLKKGKFGIMEPDESCELIDKHDIEFGIIPCVSCDLKGHRLGHGGGYYDRYLKNSNMIKTVICRKKTMYRQIPVGEHDVVMDFVITE